MKSIIILCLALFTGGITIAQTVNKRSTTVMDSSFIYNFQNNLWVLGSKKTYQYSPTLLELSAIESLNKNNVWEDTLKYIYQYDQNDMDTTQIIQSYDKNNKQWINVSKERYILDFLDYDSVDIQYNWNKQTNNWENNKKYEFTRTFYEDDSLETVFSWQNGKWVEQEKYLINPVYNVYGEDSVFLYNKYNTSIKHYEKNDVYVYLYDIHSNLKNEIHSFWNGTTWLRDSQTEYFYNQNNDDTLRIISTWNGTSWVPNTKIRNFFGSYQTSGLFAIQANLNTPFQIYPNPAENYLKINSEQNLTVKVIDLIGNVIVNKELNSGVNTLDLNNLTSNHLYILQATDEEGNNFSKNFLKK